MTRRTRRTIEADALAHLIQRIGEHDPRLRAHLAAERSICDGYPPRGEQNGPRGSAELTTVEAAVDTRRTLDAYEADIDAGWRLMQITAADMIHSINTLLGIRAPRAEAIDYCSTGTGRDGALITWTPNSRDPDNGWADPNCTNLADPGRSGQCSSCALREDRYRRRHGLPPRSHVEHAATT